MYSKIKGNKTYWYLLILAGVVSFAFGVIGSIRGLAISGNSSMLLGMFTGIGAAFIAVSIFRLIHRRFTPAKKLKEEEINLKDERNVQVLRAAYAVANMAASLLFAVMVVAFVWINYRIPAFIAVGAIWVQVVVFLISCRVLNKKM